MRQKIIFLLFFLPIIIKAQSNIDALDTHQNSVSLLENNNPKAKKVNLSELQEKQKGLHNNCKTCDKLKPTNNKNTSLTNTRKNLAQLKANQDHLISLIKNVLLNNPSDTGLLEKYKNALSLNQRQIRLAESQIGNQEKEIKEIQIKESR